MVNERDLRLKEILEKYAEGQISTDEELSIAMKKAIAETAKNEEDTSFAEGWANIVLAQLTGQIDKDALKKIESLFGPFQARLTLSLANMTKARGDDVIKRTVAKAIGSFIEAIDRLGDIPKEELKKQITQHLLGALSSAASTREEEEQLKLVGEIIEDPTKAKDIEGLAPELKEQLAVLGSYWNAVFHMNETLQLASQKRAAI